MVRDFVRRLVDRCAARIASEIRRQSPGPSNREQYAAIAELSARYAKTDVGMKELRVFSQNGEDGVLAEILSRVGIGAGFFVEFGVEDGTECNTRFLAEVLGWGGVYFEPDTESFPLLEGRYANRHDVVTMKKLVTPETVNTLFTEACVPTTFDVLSIDVDGQDYWIWEAIEDFQPSVVVIEYNSALPAAERLVEARGQTHQWDETDSFGASIAALQGLGERKGYTLVYLEIAGVNAFFVRNEYANLFGPAPTMRSPNYWLRGRGHPPGAGEYVSV
jgi:hypothetical protein